MFSVLYVELGNKHFFHLFKIFILLRFKKAPKNWKFPTKEEIGWHCTQWYPLGLYSTCMEQIFILYFELQPPGILLLLFSVFSLVFWYRLILDGDFICAKKPKEKIFWFKSTGFSERSGFDEKLSISSHYNRHFKTDKLLRIRKKPLHLLFLQFSLQRIKQFKYLALEKKTQQFFW